MEFNEETLKELERQGFKKSSDEKEEDVTDVTQTDETDDIVIDIDTDDKTTETETDALAVAQAEAKEATDALETYKKDNNIASKEAKTTAMNDYIFKKVGGEDKFKALGEYLRSRIPATDMDLINAKLASGNKGIVKEALGQAVKKYNSLRGVNTIMEGDAGHAAETAVHVTKEDFFKILKSEKYQTDPLYRKKMDDLRLKSKTADKQKYGNGQYWGTDSTGGRYAL